MTPQITENKADVEGLRLVTETLFDIQGEAVEYVNKNQIDPNSVVILWDDFYGALIYARHG